MTKTKIRVVIAAAGRMAHTTRLTKIDAIKIKCLSNKIDYTLLFALT